MGQGVNNLKIQKNNKNQAVAELKQSLCQLNSKRGS